MPSLLDQIPYVTVRLEALAADGSTSVGTGFHYLITHQTFGHISCVGTNKHVLANADRLILHISEAGDPSVPAAGRHSQWEIMNFKLAWVGHPDIDVDLAMFPIGAILKIMEENGKKPHLVQLQSNNIPSEEDIKTLCSIEEITMIGYPIGLWDSINNLPIIRRGITATPFRVDYNGKKEFLIDTACFPGSSGSPILIVNSGVYTDSSGVSVVGQRLMFLGVLWGGPQYTAEGSIVAKPVPTNQVPVALSSIPTNLGYCVKSSHVIEMESLIFDKLDIS